MCLAAPLGNIAFCTESLKTKVVVLYYSVYVLLNGIKDLCKK